FAKPFEHEKVVEVPEEDHGEIQAPQLKRLLLVSLAVESVLASGLQDVAGLAAVTGDATLHSQLFQWDQLFLMCQDDGKCGPAALSCFHLQHCSRPALAVLDFGGRGPASGHPPSGEFSDLLKQCRASEPFVRRTVHAHKCPCTLADSQLPLEE